MDNLCYLGNCIEMECHNLGYSIDDLGIFTGLSVDFLKSVADGLVIPNVKEAIVISHALFSSVERMFYLTASPPLDKGV